MRNILLFLLLVIAFGCSSRPSTVHVPPNAPAVISSNMRREHDPAFSSKEQAIVAAARRYLERRWHGPVDAYFSVERTSEGYEVFVRNVSGYENSQPLFAPGAGSTVYLRDDETVIRYFPGQ